MSKAAELAALIANVNKGSSLANKNFIINGGMQVWQRATAATAAVDGAYKTVDRFFNWVSGGGAYTTEQSTGHLATTGHENALKLAVTTADTSIAAGDYYVIGYKIEAQNLQSFKYGSSSANAVTLSFWIRATKTGTHTLFFSKNDSTQYIYVAEYTISASDTWEHKTITIEPDSNIKAAGGAITDDNGAGITIGFVLKEGSNYEGATANAWNTSKYTTSNQVNNMDSTSNTWYLTGVQLEIGKATEFEYEPYDVTLQKCLRYHYQYTTSGLSDYPAYITTPYSPASQDGSLPNSSGYITVQHPVPMRAAPSHPATTVVGSNSLNRDTSTIYHTVYQFSSTTSNEAQSISAATITAEL